jgi:hypothetical protein
LWVSPAIGIMAASCHRQLWQQIQNFIPSFLNLHHFSYVNDA